MSGRDRSRRVEAVRRFNRFYTRQIGVLQEKLLRSPFSLTEARLIYELAHRKTAIAKDLGKELGVDAGYLSRTLEGLKEKGLLKKEQSKTDGRQILVGLTRKGQDAFTSINARSQTEIEAMLNKMAPGDQERLVEAMGTIESLMGGKKEAKAPYILRPHQPGDMGQVVHLHGALYAQEYGWDERFEALVAEITAKFIKHFDPKKERCWMAEKDGNIVGSVFLVKKSEKVAKLRLLIVEPKARGLGIGSRLVEECLRFSRQNGYRKIILWTNSILYAARHIYEKAGFRLTGEEKHHSFGHDLVGETWELNL